MGAEGSNERIDESIPLDEVARWIRNCGYEGKMPDTAEGLWELWRRLTKERRPSWNQLRYLTDLGYKGREPKTMYDASVLIDRYKKRDYPSPEQQRKEWVKGRREEFKEYIEEDFKNDDGSYDAEFDDNDFILVGWKLEFDEADEDDDEDDDEEIIECPKRQELEGLIYLAQFQVSDIVAHLPPFDECPVGCDACHLESVVLGDIPTSKNQYNIQYVQWESPKLRSKLPKYVFKVFDAPPPFTPKSQSSPQQSTGSQQPEPELLVERELTPEEKRQANIGLAGCAALIVFVMSAFFIGFWKTVGVFLFVLAAIVGFRYYLKNTEKVHKFVSNNLQLILIGATITAVLLVFVWLFFVVFR
jgi:hypothetical protein